MLGLLSLWPDPAGPLLCCIGSLLLWILLLFHALTLALTLSHYRNLCQPDVLWMFLTSIASASASMGTLVHSIQRAPGWKWLHCSMTEKYREPTSKSNGLWECQVAKVPLGQVWGTFMLNYNPYHLLHFFISSFSSTPFSRDEEATTLTVTLRYEGSSREGAVGHPQGHSCTPGWRLQS